MRTVPVMGAACLDGWIASGSVARRALESWLPVGIRLVAADSQSTDLHPIVCICGNLTETTILFGGFTIPTGVDYREFAILVPLVRHADDFLGCFVLQMYSSVPTAVMVGNAYYGFAKQETKIQRQGPAWSVVGDDGTILAHAAFQLREKAVTAAVDPIQTWLALPLIGRKADGTLITSRFEWDFDSATLRPADSRIVLSGAYASDPTPVECEPIVGGTWEVRALRWRLSWPSTVE